MKKRLVSNNAQIQQSATKRKNNLLMNTTEVGGAPALNGLQALTTVNYFITNPNFAP